LSFSNPRRGALALVLTLCAGCGQPSQTVVVQMVGTGSLPEGVGPARVTLEEIRVQVEVPGEAPQWQLLLGDEVGGRTFDLGALHSAALVAEADLPSGALRALEITLDTDEPPEPGVLPVEGPTRLELPLDAPAHDAPALQLEWDLQRCVVRDASGRAVLHLQPSVEVLR
jgi:hypothetical protein